MAPDNEIKKIFRFPIYLTTATQNIVPKTPAIPSTIFEEKDGEIT